MAWGLFKKIKNAFKKAAQWTKDKVIKPVINTAKKIVTPENIKKAIDFGTKVAPLIGGAVGASQGNPMAGLKAGHLAQGLGNSLGFG